MLTFTKMTLCNPDTTTTLGVYYYESHHPDPYLIGMHEKMGTKTCLARLPFAQEGRNVVPFSGFRDFSQTKTKFSQTKIK